MRKNLLEVTDERGVEFYLVPSLGRKNEKCQSDQFIFVKYYLENLIEGMGFDSNRIGLNGDVITMANFLAQMIQLYEVHFNDDEQTLES